MLGKGMGARYVVSRTIDSCITNVPHFRWEVVDETAGERTGA
jgi:hypothetical protein